MSVGCVKTKVIVAALVAVTMSPVDSAFAAKDLSVFPVKGVFWNEEEKVAIDQEYFATISRSSIASFIQQKLLDAFKGRVGELTAHSLASTFAVSFHLTRAATYSAKKADGNVEVLTPVTGSLYFTNLSSGEILFTVAGTNIAKAIIPASQSIKLEAHELYASALNELISHLATKASSSFQPRYVEAKIQTEHNGMYILSSGFRAGLQTGDSLDDDEENLINVIYSGEDYSIAESKFPGDLKVGTVFRKPVTGKIDGRFRPRVSVVIDGVPLGFTSEYIDQLFSEELGDKAPISLVRVNPTFSLLKATAMQQASLTGQRLAQRDAPEFVIRLRVEEPITYETNTNLAFKTVRGFEVNAFADLIDESGRVLFSAIGTDQQQIEVTNSLDLDLNARREISVKNAIISLAKQFANLSEAKTEELKITAINNGDILAANENKILPLKQGGFILKATEILIGGKKQKTWIPVSDASIEARIGKDSRIKQLLPFGKKKEAVAVGDVFQTLQFGKAPKTDKAFTLCGDHEKLGEVDTPYMISLTNTSLGHSMPGMYYSPDVRAKADQLINPRNGFDKQINWSIPPAEFCIQLAHRVNVTGEVCDGDNCQKKAVARYTLRVKKGSDLVSRDGLEGNFTSGGYNRATSPAAINALLQSDLVDEAKKLLDGVAAKITFEAKK